jgi:solute carrier family 25 citrate transporter 1
MEEKKQEAKKELKGGWRTFVAGGAAGAIDCCITMPLDTLGTQIQLQGYKTPMEATRAIVQASGVKGLYAGFWPFLIQSSAKSSIRFFAFEALSKTADNFGADRKKNPGFWSLACGLGAGSLEALGLTAPTDRVKVLNQALSAEKGGVPVTTAQLIKERGVMTLYVGGLSTTLRQSTSVAVRFFCFGKIKNGMCDTFGYDVNAAPAWLSFMAGGIGGAVSVGLNNPIDIAKSKIQAGHSNSIVGAIAETAKKDGLFGLTAGLSARMPRLFLSQAIQFSLVDVFNQILNQF